MAGYNFKYIYGPVSSWRLGSSLGIDLLAQEVKICSFNCIYCQLGEKGVHTLERKIYVPGEEVIAELNQLPDIGIDYITFSGQGEPTLAENLEEIITEIRKIRKEPLAILTNSSLLYFREVRRALKNIDFVIAKLDACSEEVFQKVNRPTKGLSLEDIVKGIQLFRRDYSGKLGIQIMFVSQNKNCAEEISAILKNLKPDEVQLNTPLRPCGLKPLSVEEMTEIKIYFREFNTRMVYEAEPKKIMPLSDEETIKRRGKI